ncbi:hypothetical protein Skr01_35000 [Sphaerisporangium krabiense]|uniref:Uncharacterized protein YecE (DUF72 family) n=1 Tax=Sphaerisporangium krabiense TaxID=763782 RepID=A0A7W8Z2Y5_9ACTN|nr:DUF72 domain-containing protein [Sphaerisporangium krabiense]MBB5626493.1 uncharacterized protein YecE (DUF72 family) [Sphaerisporangium krabiense]GII63415.1 hypothetical protein Skr01_35000 [Sphaerisporangium krabiense]
MRLHVGCAMWTHTSWQGRFLPHPLPPGERLRAYATWCNAVEGNTTFYATPSRGTVESWARQIAPDFRFLVKLPKTVTHERRLTDAGEELRPFLHAIEPLGPRVQALWVQLPGTFGPSDVDTLAGFLRGLPDSYNYAVEVRHRAFFQDARAERLLEGALAESGAEWIPFDTVDLFQRPPVTDAEREAWSRKPRMPRRSKALTTRPVVRYIGRDDVTLTVEGRRYWAETVAGWLREGRSPTVFIHTPDNTEALALARRFHDDVRALVPEVEPLPEPMPAEPLTLF